MISDDMGEPVEWVGGADLFRRADGTYCVRMFRRGLKNVVSQDRWATVGGAFDWAARRLAPSEKLIPRVIIESPLAASGAARFTPEGEAEVARNVAYAKRAMGDSLDRGEAPYASHMLYTQVLDDTVPEQRRAGIEAGLRWGQAAELSAVYVDYDISPGMVRGIERARAENRRVEFRRIGENP